MRRAKEIYTKVVRSAMVYGASAWHRPAAARSRGIAKDLAPQQSRCLRTVAGAYKATPVRSLETETHVPPIDLYLNKAVADFERRLERTGMGEQIRRACGAIAGRLRRRGYRAKPGSRGQLLETGVEKAEWAIRWRGGCSTTDEAMTRDWESRWRADRESELRRKPLGYRQPADLNADFTVGALDRHLGMWKHESSALIQVRTGKVGLKAFLFQRRVPEIATPHCRCGLGKETPVHLALHCPEEREARERLRAAVAPKPLRSGMDFAAVTTDPETAKAVVWWFLSLGRIQHFQLAEEIASTANRERSDCPPRKKRRKKKKRPAGRAGEEGGGDGLEGAEGAENPPQSPIWLG